MKYPHGLDPYTSRQHLLHHTYSPLISIQATHNADLAFQTLLSNDSISSLQILKPYGNNAKYSIPNQSFKIINNQLMTKNYPSFPIRFEPSLPELIELTSTNSQQLFSIKNLELLLSKVSKSYSEDLYLKLFNKIIISNKLVPFETFNHPICQIFVIDFTHDNFIDLRKLIVNFRNYNFPKYFQIDDLLIHIFIIYQEIDNKDQILELQNQIKSQLNISSTLIPLIDDNDENNPKFLKVNLSENSTIQEELQRISLNEHNTNYTSTLNIPKSLDKVLRNKIFEFISKFLIPHMQSKIRYWDDQILQPKKSITNRIFLVSRKIFSSRDNQNLNHDNPTGNFNHQENYYYKSTPEQTIRKLADWALILKDFKYAYSTYDIIKKDYTNDKAWTYVASTQEMCIVSLLLAQTQQINPPIVPDRNTLRKIKHDIIESYMDNLSYSFTSRLNLRTYTLRTLMITVELLLCMSNYFNINQWWSDSIERYLIKCISEFDQHMASTNQNPRVINAILYERLGYSFGKNITIVDSSMIDFSAITLETSKPPETTKSLISDKTLLGPEIENDDISEKEVNADDTDEYYKNENKLTPLPNSKVAGLTKFRKSALWYLLSIKEWLELENYQQVEYLMNNIKLVYNIYEINPDEYWYDKNDLIVGYAKRVLKEQDKLDH